MTIRVHRTTLTLLTLATFACSSPTEVGDAGGSEEESGDTQTSAESSTESGGEEDESETTDDPTDDPATATASETGETSEAPVIFSHSSAFAKCNSTRNVQDDLLKLLVSFKLKSRQGLYEESKEPSHQVLI